MYIIVVVALNVIELMKSNRDSPNRRDDLYCCKYLEFLHQRKLDKRNHFTPFSPPAQCS